MCVQDSSDITEKCILAKVRNLDKDHFLINARRGGGGGLSKWKQTILICHAWYNLNC